MGLVDALVSKGKNFMIQESIRDCPAKPCKGCDFPPTKSGDCAYHCKAWAYWKASEKLAGVK